MHRPGVLLIANSRLAYSQIYGPLNMLARENSMTPARFALASC